MTKRYKPPTKPDEPDILLVTADGLKLWRIESKLSQREVAERMHISSASVCHVEKGQTNPSKAFLEGYARAIGTTPLVLQTSEPQEVTQVSRLLEIWKSLLEEQRISAFTMLEAFREKSEAERTARATEQAHVKQEQARARQQAQEHLDREKRLREALAARTARKAEKEQARANRAARKAERTRVAASQASD